MKSAAEHNALYGPSLTKRVLTSIEAITASGKPATAWGITKRLLPKGDGQEEERRLYKRIAEILEQLEGTGDIRRTYHFDPELKRGANHISICT